jgi:hypothetical protein
MNTTACGVTELNEPDSAYSHEVPWERYFLNEGNLSDGDSATLFTRRLTGSPPLRRERMIKTLMAGFLAGATSWAVCRFFGKFEPFDTTPGLYLGQTLLVSTAIFVSWKYPLKFLLLLTLGIHLGQNAYNYVFGSSEAKAWFMLGLLTSLVFLILPLISGGITMLIRTKLNKKLK